MNINQEK